MHTQKKTPVYWSQSCRALAKWQALNTKLGLSGWVLLGGARADRACVKQQQIQIGMTLSFSTHAWMGLMINSGAKCSLPLPRHDKLAWSINTLMIDSFLLELLLRCCLVGHCSTAFAIWCT